VAAAIGALPAGASADGLRQCGKVSGERHGVEWSGTLKAANLGCRNAKRLVRACVTGGVLAPGWSLTATTSGALKFSKGPKRVVAAIAAADPNLCIDGV